MVSKTAIVGLALFLGLSVSSAEAATVHLRSTGLLDFGRAHTEVGQSRSTRQLARNSFRTVKAIKSRDAARSVSRQRTSGLSRQTNQVRSGWQRPRGNPQAPVTPAGPGTPPNSGTPPGTVSQAPLPDTTTYLWSFDCDAGAFCSGSGTLITNAIIGAGPALVTSFTGMILGEPIVELFGPDDWWRNDNLIYSLTDEILNEGISGRTENWYFNVYLSLVVLADGTLAGDSILYCDASTRRRERLCNRKDAAGLDNYYTAFARGEFLVVPSPGEATVVPLPATLPLMAAGLGVLGFLGWRRRRMASSSS